MVNNGANTVIDLILSIQPLRRTHLSAVKPFKLVVLEKCTDFNFEVVSIMMNDSCLQVFQSVQNGWKSAVFSPTLDSTEAKCKQIRNVTNHLKRAGDKIIHFPLSFA